MTQLCAGKWWQVWHKDLNEGRGGKWQRGRNKKRGNIGHCGKCVDIVLLGVGRLKRFMNIPAGENLYLKSSSGAVATFEATTSDAATS